MSTMSTGGTTLGAGHCLYCGAWHTGMCPRIKRIVYYPNGKIRAIEFTNGDSQFEDMDDMIADMEDGFDWTQDSGT